MLFIFSLFEVHCFYPVFYHLTYNSITRCLFFRFPPLSSNSPAIPHSNVIPPIFNHMKELLILSIPLPLIVTPEHPNRSINFMFLFCNHPTFHPSYLGTNYSNVIGFLIFIVFLLQFMSGLLLSSYYPPTIASSSVYYIMIDVNAGIYLVPHNLSELDLSELDFFIC